MTAILSPARVLLHTKVLTQGQLALEGSASFSWNDAPFEFAQQLPRNPEDTGVAHIATAGTLDDKPPDGLPSLRRLDLINCTTASTIPGIHL